MHIGIAILTDVQIHNIARNITLNLNKKYKTGIESALLPQHISLKQSFPYCGDINVIEEYIKRFCLSIIPLKYLLIKLKSTH